MNRKREHETWLDLSEAAEYLGVHFTTLRRWADAGEIACMRTPGKRRRFSLDALEDFLRARQQGGPTALNGQAALAVYEPLRERAIVHTRESVRKLPPGEGWIERIDGEQRARMRGTGHRLMALLLQYTTRGDGGEAFLEEGQRIMHDYSQVCFQAGMNLPETVRVFLFFRRSILDAVHETGRLEDREDQPGMRLYHRTTDFLDQLILALIRGYQDQIAITPGA